MIVNNDTALPDLWLKKVLKFAAQGVVDTHVYVVVNYGTNAMNSYGSCQCRRFPLRGWTSLVNRHHKRIVWWPDRTKALVDLYIPVMERDEVRRYTMFSPYRIRRVDAKYPKGIPIETIEDRIVRVAAHEFRHVWQGDRVKRAMVQDKTISKKSEHDAESHAIKMVNKWRVATGRKPIKAVKQANPFPVMQAATPKGGGR